MDTIANVNVDRIKERAKSMGITMTFLCKTIGKYPTFLACVRNGTDRIDEDELAVIAGKINTTVAYLTGQTDDPEKPNAVPEGTSDKNILRLAGRDGTYQERILSDEQMEILRKLVAQLPEAPEDL